MLKISAKLEQLLAFVVKGLTISTNTTQDWSKELSHLFEAKGRVHYIFVAEIACKFAGGYQ